MTGIIGVAVIVCILMFIIESIVFALLRAFGVYTIVKEGTCHVYILFGRVLTTITEPGLHLLWSELGWRALIVNWFGQCKVVDLRLDQQYLRSQPVNSEEGAPMGIGIWYEMYVSDPIAFLFRNADPGGSLAASVSNATIRCLSNMPLQEMLENRHAMSKMVREEVTQQSQEWGYRLGSVYIRKVHFRDQEMIRQIESKVVNRLRQVTSAIRQDGANQVNIITSTAERQAAIEFARAAAIRPAIVGAALEKIGKEPKIAQALFDILETEQICEGKASLTLLPQHSDMMLKNLLLAEKDGQTLPTG